jgi:threonine aldolase
VLGSIQPQPIAHQADGTLALADIAAAIKPDDMHFARTRLLCAGEHLRRPGDAAGLAAGRHGAGPAARPGHPPGWRPVVQRRGGAVGRSMAEMRWPRARAIAGLYDSVSVCFSKGLGAPVGSALVGTADLISPRPPPLRKMLAAAMRQAGVLAAAAAHALDHHHVERLADDHAHARRLAEGLAGLPGVAVVPPDTNIVFVDLAPGKDGARHLLRRAAERGVRCTGLASGCAWSPTSM